MCASETNMASSAGHTEPLVHLGEKGYFYMYSMLSLCFRADFCTGEKSVNRSYHPVFASCYRQRSNPPALLASYMEVCMYTELSASLYTWEHSVETILIDWLDSEKSGEQGFRGGFLPLPSHLVVWHPETVIEHPCLSPCASPLWAWLETSASISSGGSGVIYLFSSMGSHGRSNQLASSSHLGNLCFPWRFLVKALVNLKEMEWDSTIGKQLLPDLSFFQIFKTLNWSVLKRGGLSSWEHFQRPGAQFLALHDSSNLPVTPGISGEYNVLFFFLSLT